MTNSIAPAYLVPDYRYAGDAWVGANALTYVVYETAPVYAADGVTEITAGVPQPLAGYSVAGTIIYQTRCGSTPVPQAFTSLPVPVGAVLDPLNGIISLSLTAAQTVFPRQSFLDWSDPTRARLVVQPRIVDPLGNPVTVGLQQLFVF